MQDSIVYFHCILMFELLILKLLLMTCTVPGSLLFQSYDMSSGSKVAIWYTNGQLVWLKSSLHCCIIIPRTACGRDTVVNVLVS